MAQNERVISVTQYSNTLDYGYIIKINKTTLTYIRNYLQDAHDKIEFLQCES